jgi:hypothetical protein
MITLAIHQNQYRVTANASGPNLTLRFAREFPARLACANVRDARASEHPTERCRPPKKAHADLVELRVNLERLVAGKNIPLIRSINDYVERQAVTPKAILDDWWQGILEKVQSALESVYSILNDVSKIRNDFVLEDAYRTLQQTLMGRVTVLGQLKNLPAPVERDELEALAKAGKEYQKLTEATQKASDQIGAYLKAVEKSR